MDHVEDVEPPTNGDGLVSRKYAKVGLYSDPETCDCGKIQTMNHLLDCRLLAGPTVPGAPGMLCLLCRAAVNM